MILMQVAEVVEAPGILLAALRHKVIHERVELLVVNHAAEALLERVGSWLDLLVLDPMSSSTSAAPEGLPRRA